jgi:hypothetical protein
MGVNGDLGQSFRVPWVIISVLFALLVEICISVWWAASINQRLLAAEALLEGDRPLFSQLSSISGRVDRLTYVVDDQRPAELKEIRDRMNLIQKQIDDHTKTDGEIQQEIFQLELRRARPQEEILPHR